ncbi:unnamed protein product [Pleuronectes platessa]|uniref:Uncharacterized protein n=1 Tax=Pleuronectes platessa TaxID=8262 RepID=A0A9N7V381_PLEPL|nr:unnamed protein product [Pleuronectes platessa]
MQQPDIVMSLRTELLQANKKIMALKQWRIALFHHRKQAFNAFVCAHAYTAARILPYSSLFMHPHAHTVQSADIVVPGSMGHHQEPSVLLNVILAIQTATVERDRICREREEGRDCWDSNRGPAAQGMKPACSTIWNKRRAAALRPEQGVDCTFSDPVISLDRLHIPDQL